MDFVIGCWNPVLARNWTDISSQCKVDHSKRFCIDQHWPQSQFPTPGALCELILLANDQCQGLTLRAPENWNRTWEGSRHVPSCQEQNRKMFFHKTRTESWNTQILTLKQLQVLKISFALVLNPVLFWSNNPCWSKQTKKSRIYTDQATEGILDFDQRRDTILNQNRTCTWAPEFSVCSQNSWMRYAEGTLIFLFRISCCSVRMSLSSLLKRHPESRRDCLFRTFEREVPKVNSNWGCRQTHNTNKSFVNFDSQIWSCPDWLNTPSLWQMWYRTVPFLMQHPQMKGYLSSLWCLSHNCKLFTSSMQFSKPTLWKRKTCRNTEQNQNHSFCWGSQLMDHQLSSWQTPAMVAHGGQD